MPFIKRLSPSEIQDAHLGLEDHQFVATTYFPYDEIDAHLGFFEPGEEPPVARLEPPSPPEPPTQVVDIRPTTIEDLKEVDYPGPPVEVGEHETEAIRRILCLLLDSTDSRNLLLCLAVCFGLDALNGGEKWSFTSMAGECGGFQTGV